MEDEKGEGVKRQDIKREIRGREKMCEELGTQMIQERGEKE